MQKECQQPLHSALRYTVCHPELRCASFYAMRHAAGGRQMQTFKRNCPGHRQQRADRLGGGRAARRAVRRGRVRPERPAAPAAGRRLRGSRLSSDDSVRDGLRQVRERHGGPDRLGDPPGRLLRLLGRAQPASTTRSPSAAPSGCSAGCRTSSVEQFVFSSTMLVHAAVRARPAHQRGLAAGAEVGLPAVEGRRPRNSSAPSTATSPSCCCGSPASTTTAATPSRSPTRSSASTSAGSPATSTPATRSRGQAFLHLDDLVDAFGSLVERRGQLPRELTLLLGEPETLSYDELQRDARPADPRRGVGDAADPQGRWPRPAPGCRTTCRWARSRSSSRG